MCPFTQVRYKCGHQVYTVRAWCEKYERTHIRCKVYIVAYERRYVLCVYSQFSLLLPSFHSVVLCSQVSLPSPPSLQFSHLHPIFSLYISLSMSTSTTNTNIPQKLRLRSMPTRRRGALDGSPQDPHPHPTPPQPCMAPTATPSPRLEEPIIHQMPSINEMGRPPADHPHTTPPTTLTSPASLASTAGSIRTYSTTYIRLHIRYNDTYTIELAARFGYISPYLYPFTYAKQYTIIKQEQHGETGEQTQGATGAAAVPNLLPPNLGSQSIFFFSFQILQSPRKNPTEWETGAQIRRVTMGVGHLGGTEGQRERARSGKQRDDRGSTPPTGARALGGWHCDGTWILEYDRGCRYWDVGGDLLTYYYWDGGGVYCGFVNIYSRLFFRNVDSLTG